MNPLAPPLFIILTMFLFAMFIIFLLFRKGAEAEEELQKAKDRIKKLEKENKHYLER